MSQSISNEAALEVVQLVLAVVPLALYVPRTAFRTGRKAVDWWRQRGRWSGSEPKISELLHESEELGEFESVEYFLVRVKARMSEMEEMSEKRGYFVSALPDDASILC